MNQYTEKVFDSIDQNPELLNQLLDAQNQPMTRSGAPVNPLYTITGPNIGTDDMKQVAQDLSDNPAVQLYLASEGALDAKDLLDYVGGVRGVRANNNAAVRALFDGRLDIKDIVLIIILLKLFKRKNSNTYNNSAIGLLGTLLGFNSYNNSGSLLQTLLGGNQNNTGGLFGNSYYSGGNLFNSSYNNNSGLGSFLGLNTNNNGLHNLINFVNGSYNNNSQYSTLFNILSQVAGSAVSSSGNVSASGLFSVLNALLQ